MSGLSNLSRLQRRVALLTLLTSVAVAAPAPGPAARPATAPSPPPPSQAIKPPIFLLPGSGASALDANFTTPAFQRACNNGSTTFWLQDISNIQGNSTCVQDAMPLTFNTTTSLWNNNSNANVYPHNFGGIDGVVGLPLDNSSIHPIWLGVVQQLQSQGYVVGKNIYGAPYDWRISFYNLEQIGWFGRLQSLVETAVKSNNQTKAILCGHSLGTLVTTYFLNSYTTAAWREEYIAAYFSFSGLYGGAAIAFTQFIEGNSFGFNVSASVLQPAARTWGSLVQRAPNPEIWGNQVLISSRSKNYTARDMRQLLYDINLSQQVATYDRIQATIYNLTDMPTYVDTYCIMGNSVPTPLSVFYDVPSLNNSAALNSSSTIFGFGDGTINQISLDECVEFDPIRVLNYTGMTHGGVLFSPQVLSDFMTYVNMYTVPPTRSGTG